MMKYVTSFVFIILCAFMITVNISETASAESVNDQPKRRAELLLKDFPAAVTKTANTSLTFPYPDAVRGIYVSGSAAGSNRFNELIKFLKQNDLNTMVIDFKEDSGKLVYKPAKGSPLSAAGSNKIKSIPVMLRKLEKEQIYPIARIVVFKDSHLAYKRPEWTFRNKGKVWRNERKEAFINPFVKEVWDYNIAAAVEAAKLGFQEIQFDYVRFPEGFEKKGANLSYSKGDYGKLKISEGQKRVKAVSDFVKYAKDKLEPYDVKVSVDIFGYTATLEEAPGIGQNFTEISKNVDVISSMIYPSHWGSYFGISKPDLEPYRLVNAYMKLERKKLTSLKKPPISRPWIQDFTAAYLGKGNYQPYGKLQVEAQIKALYANGVREFLLWNAGCNYTDNVNYKMK